MERARLARDIIDTCLEMTRMGLNQGTAGNISVRYREGMLITPTGIPYEHLTEESIVYVDAQGGTKKINCPPANGVFIRLCIRPARMLTPSSITMRLTVPPSRYSTAPFLLFTI